MKKQLERFDPDFRGKDLLPSVQCKSIEDFERIVRLLGTDPNTQWVFRGQRRAVWPLTPGLARELGEPFVRKDVANEQVKLFRKAIRGRVSDHGLLMEESDNQVDELWSVGQHHGLFTPLLDWTFAPYVALFFAFEKSDDFDSDDDPDGLRGFRAVYALNKTLVESAFSEESDLWLRFVEPRKDDHGRLVNQAGLFTISAYDSTLEEIIERRLAVRFSGEEELTATLRHVVKILIPNERQPDVLRSLRRMNIHHASLFPDLLGAANDCNSIVKEKFGPPMIEPEPIQDAFVPTEVPEAEGSYQGWTLVDSSKIHSLLQASGVPDAVAQSVILEMEQKAAPILATVDWSSRESQVSRLRNLVLAILRRHGLGPEFRSVLIPQILIQNLVGLDAEPVKLQTSKFVGEDS